MIGSNAHDETPIGGQQHHYLWSPGPGGDCRDGGGWDGEEELTAAVGEGTAALALRVTSIQRSVWNMTAC